MVGFWIRAGKAITGVKPGAKFKGQKTKESIIKAGKEKKRYFTNQPPKKTKTKTKHYTAPKDF